MKKVLALLVLCVLSQSAFAIHLDFEKCVHVANKKFEREMTSIKRLYSKDLERCFRITRDLPQYNCTKFAYKKFKKAEGKAEEVKNDELKVCSLHPLRF